ncbi:MAG: helix-turn-helix domain-containing protein [Proteobacteria bacterium]|nr:helix-turn-helix domain-containing protein [Pseudomonadota bacterium]
MAEIIKMPVKEAGKSSEKKWGKIVIQCGFCIVPSLLFRAQKRLGLNSQQLIILLQLADFWWDKSRKPYPAVGTIAERIGLSQRQTRRHIAALEKAGFIKRIQRTAVHKGKLSNEYDLTGLVDKLRKLAPEFKEANIRSKKILEDVEKRNALLRRNS